MKIRLDSALVSRGLVVSRSQAESYIRLGQVTVDSQVITKTGYMVSQSQIIKLLANEQYVSRAGLKLASVADVFKLDFRDKVVLDVGSSTGGFTDYSLRRGAKKVIAIDVGTKQLHPSLRTKPKIELHEQTDIRKFAADYSKAKSRDCIDIVLVDVSFVSLRDILPAVAEIMDQRSQLVAMVKPQFEAENQNLKHKGVIKNEAARRSILSGFEAWSRHYFKIINKADSQISGEKGNKERFYILKKLV